jgi:hypothetical protein
MNSIISQIPHLLRIGVTQQSTYASTSANTLGVESLGCNFFILTLFWNNFYKYIPRKYFSYLDLGKDARLTP